MTAAMCGHTEVAMALIKRGADTEAAEDHEGQVRSFPHAATTTKTGEGGDLFLVVGA